MLAVGIFMAFSAIPIGMSMLCPNFSNGPPQWFFPEEYDRFCHVSFNS